jgi:hypothetical protein
LDSLKNGIKSVLSWEYQTDKVIMLPYSEKHLGVFPENFLGCLYYRLKEDDTLKTIFPGMDMSHVNKFIAYMSKVQGFVICCLKTETKPEPIGLGWVSEFDRVKLAFGFGFFRSAWRKREHVDLSFFMLKFWFDAFKVANIYGTTLNPVANNYSKRFGFQHIGLMPEFFDCNGVGTDAHLIVLQKQVFLKCYSAWRSKVEIRALGVK